MTDYISYLPHLNALLNSTSTVFLVMGFIMIRKGRIKSHLKFQLAAVITSTLFLISYLIYHYHHGDTRFLGQGIVRPFYFTILITHVVLAMIIVPLVLVTLFRAWRSDFTRHKRIAHWTLPIWLYVSVTGVIVYVMLYHLYPTP